MFEIVGTDSSEYLTGTDGPDSILARCGNDTLDGGADDDVLRGEDGDDLILGGAGFDNINGNKGEDAVYGGDGTDWISGGQGADVLHGEAGADLIYGNLGSDACWGEDGSDTIRGGQGDDQIVGGSGDDWLSGDRGSDTLTGGSGADSFHSFAEAGRDVIVDFNRLEGDRIVLDPGTPYFVRQAGGDTFIDFDSSDSVVLQNLSLSALNPNRVESIAHRGAAGGGPEESLAAYDRAYAKGVRSMEMDLQVTKDGYVVLIHDTTVDRTTYGRGNVNDLTLGEIQAMGVRGGENATITTWGQFICWAALHPDVHIYPEIKSYRDVSDIDKMLAPLEQGYLESRTTLASFRFGDLQYARGHQFTGEILQYMSAAPVEGVEAAVTNLVALGGAVAVGMQDLMLIGNSPDVEIARRLGADVLAWVVNSPSEVSTLLSLDVHRFVSDVVLKGWADDGWLYAPQSPGGLS